MRFLVSARIAAFVFIFVISIGATALGAPQYALLALSNLSGQNSASAAAINNKCQIAGESGGHAVVWEDYSQIRELKSLSDGDMCAATAINDKGQVAGWSRCGKLDNRAVVWEPDGSIHDLGTLGKSSSTAYDINNLGQVVGTYYDKQGDIRAFLWSKSTGMVDLGALPGGKKSAAYAINDAGEIAGWAANSNGKNCAVIWKADRTMVEFPVAAAVGSEAQAISENGLVSGHVDTSVRESDGFLWSQSAGEKHTGRLNCLPEFMGFIDRGCPPGSVAAGVNDAGAVVGCSDKKNAFGHAFYWSEATGVIDLGVLDEPVKKDADNGDTKIGAYLKATNWYASRRAADAWSYAHAINNAGVIAGSSNGRAVCWIPNDLWMKYLAAKQSQANAVGAQRMLR